MYAFIPLVLATAVLALPRNPRDASTPASDTVHCPDAPSFPIGATPGDSCGGGSSSASSAAPSPSSSASHSRRHKRDGFSTCRAVTIEDYNASPMKDPIEAIAKRYWGSTGTVVVNPTDYPERPLHFCFTTDTVDATFDKPPTCSTQQNNIAGYVAKGTADVTLSVNQGITATHLVTTEKAVSIASATEVGITLGVPDVESTSITRTLTLTSTFKEGETESTALNQQTIETVVAHATKPGPCNMMLNVTSCTGSATAIVPAFYVGFVWFDLKHPKDGHFKWALDVTIVLPADQRSDNMTLTDKISSQNSGCFTSVCV